MVFRLKAPVFFCFGKEKHLGDVSVSAKEMFFCIKDNIKK